MVRLVGLQTGIAIAENPYKNKFYPAKDIGKEVFSSLESERGVVAELLQEDIVQLISLAKMQVSGDNATEVNSYLAMAINKLRLLTFELKPQVLEQFGLGTALQTLLNQRLIGGYHQINLQRLPLGIDKLMEIAIFRLVQQVLNHIAFPHHQEFRLEVTRTGQFINLKTTFRANNFIEGNSETNIIGDKLLKAVQSNMYLFNGHCDFNVLEDGLVEFSVCLDENNQ